MRRKNRGKAKKLQVMNNLVIVALHERFSSSSKCHPQIEGETREREGEEKKCHRPFCRRCYIKRSFVRLCNINNIFGDNLRQINDVICQTSLNNVDIPLSKREKTKDVHRKERNRFIPDIS